MKLLPISTLAVILAFGIAHPAFGQTPDPGSQPSPQAPRVEAPVRGTPGPLAPPRVLYAPEPDIPAHTNRHLAGNVLVGLKVNEKGEPTDVRILRGLDPDFDKAALSAVRQYRFKPAMRDGHTVPFDMRVEVNFNLN